MLIYHSTLFILQFIIIIPIAISVLFWKLCCMVSSLKQNHISVNKFIHFHDLHLTLVFTNIELIALWRNSIKLEIYGYFASVSQLDRKHVSHDCFDAMNAVHEWLSNRTHATLLLSYHLAHSTCFHRTAKWHGHFQNCKQIEKWIIRFFTNFFHCVTHTHSNTHTNCTMDSYIHGIKFYQR